MNEPSEKHIPSGNPLPLGIIPDFVIQHNSISQGVYDISVMAKRLVAMTMGLLPPDFSIRTAQFTIDDFCKALGLERGGMTDASISKALQECMKETGAIHFKEIEKGKKPISKIFMFFTEAKLDPNTNIIIIKFNDGLADYLVSLQKMFSKIHLEDLGKLSSKYALRYFEMALSHKGFEGKRGNKKNQWWFEISLDDLKQKFMIKDDEYKRTGDLKIWAIEKPIKELNNADVGIKITPAYMRNGKYLTGAIFNIRYEKKASQSKQKSPKQKDTAGIPEGIRAIENAMQQRELDEALEKIYREQYPQEFAAYRDAYIAKNMQYRKLNVWLFEKSADAYAFKQLQEKYETPKGRKGKRSRL